MLALSIILWYLEVFALAPTISSSAIPARDGIPLTSPHVLDLEPRSTAEVDSTTARHLSQINLSQTLWSSGFLVFALAWIAVHPNYSSPYDSPWMKLRRRFMLLMWAVLFPELVLYWSVRQWVGARKIRDKFKGELAFVNSPFFLLQKLTLYW
jgi:hypothetical protein